MSKEVKQILQRNPETLKQIASEMVNQGNISNITGQVFLYVMATAKRCLAHHKPAMFNIFECGHQLGLKRHRVQEALTELHRLNLINTGLISGTYNRRITLQYNIKKYLTLPVYTKVSKHINYDKNGNDSGLVKSLFKYIAKTLIANDKTIITNAMIFDQIGIPRDNVISYLRDLSQRKLIYVHYKGATRRIGLTETGKRKLASSKTRQVPQNQGHVDINDAIKHADYQHNLVLLSMTTHNRKGFLTICKFMKRDNNSDGYYTRVRNKVLIAKSNVKNIASVLQYLKNQGYFIIEGKSSKRVIHLGPLGYKALSLKMPKQIARDYHSDYHDIIHIKNRLNRNNKKSNSNDRINVNTNINHNHDTNQRPVKIIKAANVEGNWKPINLEKLSLRYELRFYNCNGKVVTGLTGKGIMKMISGYTGVKFYQNSEIPYILIMKPCRYEKSNPYTVRINRVSGGYVIDSDGLGQLLHKKYGSDYRTVVTINGIRRKNHLIFDINQMED